MSSIVSIHENAFSAEPALNIREGTGCTDQAIQVKTKDKKNQRYGNNDSENGTSIPIVNMNSSSDSNTDSSGSEEPDTPGVYAVNEYNIHTDSSSSNSSEEESEILNTSSSDNDSSGESSSELQGDNSVKLSHRNAVMGNLPDGTPILLLIDSGSAVSIISKQAIWKFPYLKSLDREYLRRPYPLKVANGELIEGNYYINIPLRLKEKEMTIKALVINQNFGSMDVIIGTADLAKHLVMLDLETNRMIFKRKATMRGFRLQYDVTLPSMSYKVVTVYGRVPKMLRYKDVILSATGKGKRCLPERFMATMSGRICQVVLLNAEQEVIKMTRGTKIAKLDIDHCCAMFDPVMKMEISDESTVMYIDQVDSSEEVYEDVENKVFQIPQYLKENNKLGNKQLDKDPQIMEDPQNEEWLANLKLDKDYIHQEGLGILPVINNQYYGDNQNFKDLSNIDREEVKMINKIEYPFLQEDDPKIDKMAEEIMIEEIDLKTDCMLPLEKQEEFMKSLMNHRDAFSLYGEIGDSNHEIALKLNNTESRYIRPYYASSEDKIIIDREMNRLEKLGVIKPGLATFSSPVMLIAKRGTNKKRCVLDLRAINQRIQKLQFSFPLVEDCLEVVGLQQSSVLSCLDIRDAFFSIRLAKESQKFCGISTYAGGKPYYFVRLAMGLSVSPSVFSEYIQKIIAKIPEYEKHYVTYMDDILIHSQGIEDHQKHIELLLEALIEAGLRISPKKSLFYRTKVNYLGHTIQIVDGKPHMSIQHSKIDAIRKLKRPESITGVRAFCGMVNYLSRFLPALSTMLLPIRRLTRKNVTFEWTPECQKNFDKIKQLLMEPPVLMLPNAEGMIRLYIDTSRQAVGCSIWQTENADSKEERLIGYFSKNLPEAVKNYSISELELTGILVVITSLRLLKSRYFQIVTDHSALTHMVKSEREIPTLRLKKLFEKLSAYNFDIFYQKGKELVICDYLSRASYMTDEEEEEIFRGPPMALFIQPTTCVVTRAKARRENIQVPSIKESVEQLERLKSAKSKVEVPDKKEVLTNNLVDFSQEQDNQQDLNQVTLTDEQQILQPVGQVVQTPLGNNLASESVENQTPPTIVENISLLDLEDKQQLSEYMKTNTLIGSSLSKPLNKMEIPRQTLIPVQSKEVQQEPPPHDVYLKPDKRHYQLPEQLFKEIADSDIAYGRKLPRQQELETFIQHVKRRTLRDFTEPLKRQEISLQQQQDPYFKDIYHYLASGVLPSNKKRARALQIQAENYILVKKVLFKIKPDKQREEPKIVLCLPHESLPYFLNIYHDSLFANHMGITKTYCNLKEKYFTPNLYDKLIQYVKSCAVCQTRKTPTQKSATYPYIPRVTTSFKIMDEIHMDIKYVFQSNEGFKYLLVLMDAATRFVMTKEVGSLKCVTNRRQWVRENPGACKINLIVQRRY